MKKLLLTLGLLMPILAMNGCATYHDGMDSLTKFIDKAHCYTNKSQNMAAEGFMVGNDMAPCQSNGAT